MKIQKIMSFVLIILLLNFWVFTIECSPIPKEKLGPNDWYRIWFCPYSATCYDMVLDSDNNIYLTGVIYSYSLEFHDMVVIKYQNNSDYHYSRSWSSNGYDISYAMAMDSSNNIYLAGRSGNYTNNFYTLVKFDKDLNYQWNRTWGIYDDNICYGVVVDSQDNIYLSGHIKQETGDFDICLVKYNKSGDFQWYKIWSGIGNDYGFAITIDSSDNVYLTGRTANDLCLLKYNSSGDLQWLKIREAPGYEIGLGIGLDSKGNIFIGGETDSCTFLVKYNNSGDFQWQRTFCGELYSYCTDIVIDSTDNIYLSGLNKLSRSNGPSACVIKYDNNGTLQWHIEWGEPYIDSCRAIVIDSMNNILIAGDISAWEYQIDGIFIVRNPKTINRPIIIGAFSIILIIFLALLGILLSTYKIFKKNLVIN